MKNEMITISVPSSYIDYFGSKVAFVSKLQNYLEELAPCETCGGNHYVLPSDSPDPENSEVACPDCHAGWECFL